MLLKTKGARRERSRDAVAGGAHAAAPPAVRTAHFWWDATDTAAIAFSRPAVGTQNDRDNVWLYRMAAFDGGGALVDLVRVTSDQMTFNVATQAYELRWKPAPGQAALLRAYATPDAAVASGTSVWFRDVVGHAAPPERVSWAKPHSMRIIVDPALIPYGIPTLVTVRAFDADSGTELTGQVAINEDPPPYPLTGQQFSRTFSPAAPDTADTGRPGRVPIGLRRPPIGRVTSVPDYPDAAIPFVFYSPALAVSVDPSPRPAGISFMLTVTAKDDRTQALENNAAVSIGQNAGKANAAFPCTLPPGVNNGVVTLDGYRSAPFTVTAYVPTLRVTVDDPSPPIGKRVSVMVRAVDATTGARVDAKVFIDGLPAGTANIAFPFTFRTRIIGPLRNRTIVYPTGSVSAPPIYSDAPIPFNFPQDA